MSQEALTKLNEENTKVEYIANGETIKLTPATVKNYLVKGNSNITDQELVLFIKLCEAQKLNPFIGEAYIVKFGNDAQIVQSKSSFVRKANENPDFDGFDAGIIVVRNNEVIELDGEFKLPNDILLGGWCKVYKKSQSRPFIAKVSLAEYDKKQSIWKTHPSTMIRKTAITHALRECFPTVAEENVITEEPNNEEIIEATIVDETATEIIDIQEEQNEIDYKESIENEVLEQAELDINAPF